MPEAVKKTTGTIVAFGDIAQLSKERSKDPAADGFERYIGLEHLDRSDLKVRSWGDISDGVTFTSVFRPGQVLFGKRRAYQRKVAVAEFSGVCSGDIYVLEPKGDQLLPGLLPFLCQSEPFYDYVISMSQGGLSPRVNWKALSKFEFLLPPLEDQRRIVDVLRAGESYCNQLRSVSLSAEALFRSAVDRWFPTKGAIDSEYMPLVEASQKISDGVHKKPDYVESGVPFLTVENLTKGPGIDFTETRFVTLEDHVEFCRRTKPELGDVLLTKDGTLGIPRVIETDVEFSIFVSLALVKPKKELLDPWYLRYYFDSSLFKRHIASRVAGSALKHIHLVDLRASPIPIKPIEEQQEIAESISSVYRAYRATLSRLESSRNVLSAILAELLDTRV